ncbi:hypothetical protein [Arthrobacter sp. CAN_C5]|uniref:hypothetical protein n=1 Tax=Arthrobacter sp. CAN_C5 TaxID=2760706 RepID=UPI001AE79C73|nr:hypothetical protein [Arthrobacter sp. CAN_C5]MBP2217002.1 putative membrane protein YccC [Arthrobacter sp. CAN_C5]
MMQDNDDDRYRRVLQSVADCLDDAAAAFKRARTNPSFDREDLEALDWMCRSLNDLSATIQGLRLADGHRTRVDRSRTTGSRQQSSAATG